MTSSRRAGSAVLALLIVASLVGCGSDHGASSTQPSGAAATTAAAAPTTQVEQSTAQTCKDVEDVEALPGITALTMNNGDVRRLASTVHRARVASSRLFDHGPATWQKDLVKLRTALTKLDALLADPTVHLDDKRAEDGVDSVLSGLSISLFMGMNRYYDSHCK
jgi:hypothetical protein